MEKNYLRKDIGNMLDLHGREIGKVLDILPAPSLFS